MSTAAKADSMPVEDIIKLAADGRLRMPSFQRPFRWEVANRKELLDSIYRGYPVGTLLLWRNQSTATELGRPLDATNVAQPKSELFLIVDGQQRLTTLWETLGRQPKRGDTGLVFDLQREEVVSRVLTIDEVEGRPPIQQGNELPQVPLHLVLDAASLSAWVPPWLSIEEKRRYFEIGKRIREYRLGLYIIENADIDALRHVFDRVNTAGKPMKRDEVFDALIGSRVAVDGTTGLAMVNARLGDLEFGAIDPSTVLKALEAIRGSQVGKLDPRKLDVATAEGDLLRTAVALRESIKFLQTVAQIPHSEVLPYELSLVVLARFFAFHVAPSERNLILLRRWLWRGTLGERLGGASSALQQHVNDVVNNEDESVHALLARTGSPRDVLLDDWDRTSVATMATARGKVLVCALLGRQPRDLQTGERLHVGTLLENGLTNLLRTVVRAGPQGIGIVNKLIHPVVGSGAGAKQLILECPDEAALISHGIDCEAQAALRKGNVDLFFQRRRDSLARATREFFAQKVELERDDSASLAALTRRSA